MSLRPLVLIVDDSEPDGVYAQIMLRRSGLFGPVAFESNPEVALEALRCGHVGVSNLPEILLVDINMPRIDGFEFVERLIDKVGGCQGDCLPDIYFLTSSNADRDRMRAANYPSVRGYLTKPLSSSVVAELAEACRVRAAS